MTFLVKYWLHLALFLEALCCRHMWLIIFSALTFSNSSFFGDDRKQYRWRAFTAKWQVIAWRSPATPPTPAFGKLKLKFHGTCWSEPCVRQFFNVRENAFKFVIHQSWHFKWLVFAAKGGEPNYMLLLFLLRVSSCSSLVCCPSRRMKLLQRRPFFSSDDFKSHYKFFLKIILNTFEGKFYKAFIMLNKRVEERGENVKANWILKAGISLHDIQT